MNKKPWLGVISILILYSFFYVQPARADTITVDTDSDVLDAAIVCASVTIDSLPGLDGEVSLREAMCAANNHAGPDTIQFDLLPCFGACQIQPETPLPTLTDDGTIIDGYSQEGASPATDASPAVLVIEINGELVTEWPYSGIAITSANNEVRGLTINHFLYNGIVIRGENANNNVISGNYIGTDPNGELDMGNGADGVYIAQGASDNLIGGDESADRNLLSGNGWEGVAIHGSGTTNNTVSGNYIGLGADGLQSLGNTLYGGVRIYAGAANNTIGGAAYRSRNVISANEADGIRIVGAGTNGNTVLNNYIGLDKSGWQVRGNNGYGIYIGNQAQDNLIGLNMSMGWNFIANNALDGIHITDIGTTGNVIVNNLIGTDYSGRFRRANLRDGVRLTNGAQNNFVGGTTLDAGNVISGNDENGISISGAETMSNTVSTNYIGVDANGSTALGNSHNGIQITDSASNNLIGGTTPGERNIISANNMYGVLIEGASTTENHVLGNYIGTNIIGYLAVGNHYSGVRITAGAYYNWIGGYEVGNGNVISGNSDYGVKIDGDGTFGNAVVGNIIGADAEGRIVRGNVGHGVSIKDQTHHAYIEYNLIGGNGGSGVYISGMDTYGIWVIGNIIGAYYEGGDLIALGNGQHGVHIESPDVINCWIHDNQIAQNAFDGVYLDGADISAIEILRNSIYHNRMGINLVGGANGGITAPTISATRQGSALVDGTACPDCRVEIFGNDTSSDQGQRYLGYTMANSSGTFSASLPVIPWPYIYLTATATDEDLGTSEFSENYASPISTRYLYLPMTLNSP